MKFSRRRRQQSERATAPWLIRFVVYLARLLLRLAFGATIAGAFVAALLYLRLSQGPIQLPYVAQIVVQLFNDDSDRFEVELGNLILTSGDAESPAGLQFIDLRVDSIEGERLFAIPRLSAKFDTSELLRGNLRPTQIVIIRPQAQLLRTKSGKFQFGLGSPLANDATAGSGVVGESPQVDAIYRILDGLVGEAPLTPELSRLNEIIISDADLTYQNLAIGRSWQTRRADLRISRAEIGLRARLSVGLADGSVAGAGVVVTAERRRGGGGGTQVNISFDDLRPEHLAEQMDQMQWLRLFDAPLDGRLEATIYNDGRIEGLTGRISARAGQILAIDDRGQPFDSIQLSFAYEAGLERMQVNELALFSPALDARLSGFVDLGRSADGGVAGLAGQFQVDGLRVTVPDIFAESLRFDGGQIVAKLNFDPLQIEVADAYLRNGGLVFDVSGQARAAADGWHTYLRAGGRNLTVAQLIQHWPLVAAKNARAWVEQNIHGGKIDDLVAHLQFGDGDPQANLDFQFSELISGYLKEMTPITGARGRASMTLDELHLWMDAGEVLAVPASPVRLDGSEVRLLNLQGQPSLAEVTIRASGDTSSVLTLINQQPLGLIAKLGLDPAAVKGQGEVTALVSFPLIKSLKLDEVDVEANAKLSSLRLPFRLPGDRVVDVAGESVALRANKREMRLSGPVLIDGAPLVLDWNEYYGRGSNHRTIDLSGPVTPAFLARFGLETEYFSDGQVPLSLKLAQTGSPEFAFDVAADLGPARLEIADLGWDKAPGRKGRLEAVGSFGDGVRVSRFRLNADDLKAAGSVSFTAAGKLETAQINRLEYRGQADVALTAAQNGVGSELSLKVTGKRLDLAMFDDLPKQRDDGRGAGDAIPLSVDYGVDELVVTRKVIAKPATGTYHRDASRNAIATLNGRLAGQVPFSARYEKKQADPVTVNIESDDAGALLTAADLFKGAKGGTLRLRLQIAPEDGKDLVGTAKLKDVLISGSGTFTSILDEGGATEAATAAEQGGLSFDRVEVPFEYHEGRLVLNDVIAKGTLLAVTLEGTVDENTDEIDLVGVISPAYAITGLLDNIPVLREILSGGKGEGILAMTFKINGRLDDPSFSVNPLSLLAPGFLRKIFSGRGASPDEKFLESLKRQTD